MNYLAHLYLSGASEELRLGNFLGDFIKGRKYSEFPDEVRKGIMLHRQIDYFTDHHDTVRKSMSRLRKRYHKYSGVVVDILYDHYLSVEWKKYSNESLSSFIRSNYAILIRNYDILPGHVKWQLPIIIGRNTLGTYAQLKGIKDTLRIVSRHSSLPEESRFAMRVIKNHYEDFRNEFNFFFPDIIEYVAAIFEVELDYYRLSNPLDKNNGTLIY
jgi:acyl carrier protein phosphodiesterase